MFVSSNGQSMKCVMRVQQWLTPQWNHPVREKDCEWRKHIPLKCWYQPREFNAVTSHVTAKLIVAQVKVPNVTNIYTTYIRGRIWDCAISFLYLPKKKKKSRNARC
jgi:hypothetical protein